MQTVINKSMDYKKIYNALITRGQNRMLTEYKEAHHILPRCLGGNNDKNNLVDLTPEEHYLCHLLLVKMFPGNVKLVKAAMFMVASNSNVKRNNKSYGWLKRQYSQHLKQFNPNKDGTARKKYIREHGVPLVSKDYITDSWRKDISLRMTGSKNPIAGVKAWNHPRATEYTKSVWENADAIYKIWIDNSQPSYCKLHTLVNGTMYDSKSIGPYMNMVKYFRNNWIPVQDPEWKEFKGNK